MRNNFFSLNIIRYICSCTLNVYVKSYYHRDINCAFRSFVIVICQRLFQTKAYIFENLISRWWSSDCGSDCYFYQRVIRVVDCVFGLRLSKESDPERDFSKSRSRIVIFLKSRSRIVIFPRFEAGLWFFLKSRSRIVIFPRVEAELWFF